MPIPEPGRYRPSNLTKKQQQEQLAACYGVSMSTQQFSDAEVERMRQILASHDSQAKKSTIHDLNNPPKEQYRFQKFPMMVYDLQGSYPSRDEERPKSNSLGFETVHVPAKVISKVVSSDQELESSINLGWSIEAPSFTEEREEPLSAKYANEAGRIDAQIEEKRSVGRPRKAA